MKKQHGKDSIELYEPYIGIAKSLSDRRVVVHAKAYYEKAIKIAGLRYEEDSVQYGLALYTAGKDLTDIGWGRGAIKYLEEAYNVFSRLGDFRAALAQLYLGKAEIQKKEFSKASSHLEKALSLADTSKDNQVELVSRAFLVKVYEEQGLSDLATSHCLEIGRQTPWEQSQEAKPLYMPHPKYPRDALANSRAGSVVIDFEISEMGFAQNIKIRDSGGNSIFREAAITALKDARFAPKFENGKPVAANSSYRFGFTIVR